MIDLIGVVALLLLLAAFAGIITERLKPMSVAYLTLNLFGSLAMVWYTWVTGAWASTAMNAVWGGMAGISLASLCLTRAHR